MDLKQRQTALIAQTMAIGLAIYHFIKDVGAVVARPDGSSTASACLSGSLWNVADSRRDFQDIKWI